MSYSKSTDLAVEVAFDFVCPWCLIGLRHWRNALAQWAKMAPEAPVRWVWRGLPLLPDTPPEGLPYQSFYEARLGGSQAVAARRAQVQAAGDQVGLHFAFERIARMPSTRGAHRLVRLAGELGLAELQDRFVERVFEAYFLDGLDIGDACMLERLWRECEVRELSESPDGTGAARLVARAPMLQAAAAPLSVPTFTFSGGIQLTGAQPEGALLRALQASRALASGGSAH